MKQIAKGLMIVGAMLAAGAASCEGFDDITPVIGIDGNWSWMRTKSNGADLFPKSYWGASPYIGVRWCDFGIEAGYDWMARRNKSNTFTAGTDVVGDLVPVGDTWTTRGRARLDGWHADLLGYLCLDECFDLIGTVGFGWKKPHLSVRVTDAAGRTASQTLKGKSKGVFRLGAGAQWMVTDMVGLRALVRWENTSTVKVNNIVVSSSTIPAIPVGTFPNTGNGRLFRDAVSLSVGAFVRF